MRYKAVLFDLDGTLFDTIEDLAAAVNAALVKCGFEELPVKLVQSYIGNGSRNLIKRACAHFPDADPEIVHQCFSEYYYSHCLDNTKLYDGIYELVKDLKEKGIIVCCLTNKPDTPAQTICNYYLSDLLTYVKGSMDGVKRKPDPEIVNTCLNSIGISNTEACYVGDSEVDINTAINSNMDGISVSWGFKTREFLVENNAKVICDTVEQLREILEV